jgi:hypothetical protein
MMKRTTTSKMFLVSILALFLVILVGCSDNTDTANIGKTSSESEAPAKGEIEETVVDQGSAAVPGWEKTSYGTYSFSLPKDWKDGGAEGAWCPGGQDTTAGLPRVSLHVGSIPPIMSGKTIEEMLKFYYHSVPETISKVNKCGMEGMLVETTVEGFKHRGLILINEGPMLILDFLDCRAPEGEFNQYEETFQKILDSVGC